MSTKYRGFVSYSHSDTAKAEGLHRALETFRTGEEKKTLGRFFLDRDEMAASSNLATAIEEALDVSDYLIVLCSPASAKSKWVNAEVAYYIRHGRYDRIIPVILDGEPNAADPERECMPELLRARADAAGVEPLAVNLKGEGLKRSVTKVAARILDVPFDTLWDRQKRRQRRQTAALVAAGFVLVALGLAAMINGYRTVEQRRVNLAEENRGIGEALAEAEVQARLLAARAGEEADPVTAMLLALEAFSVPHPKPEVGFAALGELNEEDRRAALIANWLEAGHGDPNRAQAMAQIRRGLASEREVWSRRFPQGTHHIALSADGTRLLHATQSGTVTIENIDTPADRIRFQAPGNVVSVVFAEAGDRAWVAAKRGIVEVETETGARTDVASFDADDTLVRAVFSPDLGHAALSLESYAVLIADLTEGAVRPVLTAERLPSFTFQEGSVVMAAGQVLTTLRLPDGAKISELDTGTELNHVIRTATPDANLLTLVSRNDGVLIMDNETGARVTFEAENAASFASEFGVDPASGWTFFETGESHVQARLLPEDGAETAPEERQLFCGRRTVDIDIDEKERRVAVVSEEGQLCVWSLPDLALLASFDTGREIEHVRLRGEEIVTSFFDGGVLSQSWRPELTFASLTPCPEHLSELYFNASGNALVGFTGLMGICVWDMRTEPPKLHHAAGLMSNGPWMHHAPVGRGERMIFVDRHGTIFEVTAGDLDLIRALSVEGVVFQGAGYVDWGDGVIGHSVEGDLYLWADRADMDAPPVRLEGRFDTANAFWATEVDTHIPVAVGGGNVVLFDAVSGEEVLRTEFPTVIQVVGIEEVDGSSHLVIADGDGLALDWPIDDLAALPRVVTESGRYLSGKYNALMNADTPLDVAFTSQGQLIYLDATTKTRLLTLLPGDVGMVSLRSASVQPKRDFQPRKLAVLGLEDFNKAPVPLVADLPEAFRDPYGENVVAMLHGRLETPEGVTSFALQRTLLDYENRRSEDLFFRIGSEAAQRCLTPDQRAQFQLPADPPCWCAGKAYPPLSDWTRSLGRDPFREARADGSVCTPSITPPLAEVDNARD